ncbi:MAG: hypothetical protein J5769_01900 [Bacteroidales bacterium]|nr:hypothetical protein [Bacteroidales bacterium]
MKKYFIIAIAAIATMACSKVDNFDTTPDTAISFAVVNHLQQTKATAGLTYPTTVPFGTFAWWTSDDWTGIAADQTYVFMDNEKVLYKQLEASGPYVWAPNTTYYWTKSGKLTFASYSPYTEAGADNGYSEVPVYDVTKGFKFNNYTIVADTNVDLMFANLAANCNKTTNVDGTAVTDEGDSGFSGVPTIFNHALCQLNFAFRAIGRKNPNVDKIVIDVTDVDIKNIDNKGTFTQNNATRWATNHASDTTHYDFAPASTLSLEMIENTTANVSATDNYTSLGVSRILLPQALLSTTDITKDQILVVKYTVKIHYTSAPADESDPAYWATETLTSTVRLNNGSIDEWKDNQNITYRISINPYATVPVTFDPAIVDWTDVYSTDVNLNEND